MRSSNAVIIAIANAVLLAGCSVDSSAPTQNFTGTGIFTPIDDLSPQSSLLPYRNRAVSIRFKEAACSGFLYEKDVIVTAKHCVSGADCADVQLSHFPAANLKCQRVSRHADLDLAVINIAPDHGISTKDAIEWRAPILAQRTFIVGFLDGKPQIATACKVVQEERLGSNKFGYDCSAFPGLSGAAVWTRGTDKDKGVKLSGIHLGAGASGANEALALSEDVVKFIAGHHLPTKDVPPPPAAPREGSNQAVVTTQPSGVPDTAAASPPAAASSQPANGPCGASEVCGAFSAPLRALCAEYSASGGGKTCEARCRWDAAFFHRLEAKLPQGVSPYGTSTCAPGMW